MLSVVTPSVVMLNVVAPEWTGGKFNKATILSLWC
jgi:hypothetical protein